MIHEDFNAAQRPVWSSDRWHVVHARWVGNRDEAPRFDRTIVSEHDDRDAARSSARELIASLVAELAERSPATRDQVFVRRPGFQSFKNATRIVKRPR